MKVLEDGSKYNQALSFYSETIPKPPQSISNCAIALESHPKAVPQSPPSFGYMRRMINAEGRTQISLQLPKTPEPPKHARNDIQIQIQSNVMFPTDTPTSNPVSSASGKGSRIRRSMRTIGKLINNSEKRQVLSKIKLFFFNVIWKGCSWVIVGSYIMHTNGHSWCQFQLSVKGEAYHINELLLHNLNFSHQCFRNQQNLIELHTPMQASSNINLDASPLSTYSRMQRRQSLTGIPTTGSSKSRRSSLGGKPADTGW